MACSDVPGTLLKFLASLLANYARPCFSGRRTDGFSATRRGRSFSLLQAPIQERTCKHLKRRCLWQQNAILRLSKPFDKELMGPADLPEFVAGGRQCDDFLIDEAAGG